MRRPVEHEVGELAPALGAAAEVDHGGELAARRSRSRTRAVRRRSAVAEVEHEVGELVPALGATAEVEHQGGGLAPVFTAAAEVAHQVGELAPALAAAAEVEHHVGELAPVAAASSPALGPPGWCGHRGGVERLPSPGQGPGERWGGGPEPDVQLGIPTTVGVRTVVAWASEIGLRSQKFASLRASLVGYSQRGQP